jgi:hypothetical protein
VGSVEIGCVGSWSPLDARRRAVHGVDDRTVRASRSLAQPCPRPLPHLSPHAPGRTRLNPEALRRRAPAAVSPLAELWPRVDADPIPHLHATPARVARRRHAPATQQHQGHIPVDPRGLQTPHRSILSTDAPWPPCRVKLVHAAVCAPLSPYALARHPRVVAVQHRPHWRAIPLPRPLLRPVHRTPWFGYKKPPHPCLHTSPPLTPAPLPHSPPLSAPLGER